jgi:hypothetical protein
MDDRRDREELEQRLAQVRRVMAVALDPLTTERLAKLIEDLEEQLRKTQ